MSLIKCKECGKDISDTAKFCPECGFVYKKEHTVFKIIIINISVLFIVCLIILFIGFLPYLIDSISEKKALSDIVGEYKIISSSNESVNKSISITKENVKITCNNNHFPPEFEDGDYNVYIEDKKYYVITTLSTLGIEEKGNDSKYIFMLYENGKLVSQPKKNLTISCRGSTSTGNPPSDIEVEYKK